jgi:hypothetical protein
VLEPDRATTAIVLTHAVLLIGCVTSAVSKPADAGAGADVVVGCEDVTGPIAGTPVATFDTDAEGFILDPAASSYGITNLADLDAGITPPPTLSYDGTDGNPTPGSIEIVAPFSGANQDLLVFRSLGCDAPQDWTGKVLRARIKIVKGEFTQPALLYVGTSTDCTTYAFAFGAFAQLAHTSCWQELSLDLANPATKPAGYDPASVIAFGVTFSTLSSSGAGPATFLVDSFSVE